MPPSCTISPTVVTIKTPALILQRDLLLESHSASSKTCIRAAVLDVRCVDRCMAFCLETTYAYRSVSASVARRRALMNGRTP